ncbi:glycerol kinase GlpK [Marinobacter panjinensis]|uniref:Glycerol kinase n=1 Tax=Marinobacter panjinensis TaxID=2576384 RepID=A0A4U6R1M4_9GAMM|nr:glycerol kinase GlpK [Marinobacter panjinensis]MCR8913969.1 glycerol kinase GlpK [Marinobacter panjinensis]TKV67400.1 glycerol kinase GlpK [Marinobacter panjinensis]
MTQFILSIDQGTTSSRAILFTLDANIHASSQQEFPQHFPASGWVEHDPEDIWRTVREVCDEVMDKGCGDSDEVVAVGITNQRETTVLWDRATGEAVYPAIVWQDRRTADWCESLKKQSLEPSVNNKTGLLIDPYFSATKIRWVLDNVPGARQRAEKGELAFGTIDSFLLWRLTGGKVHRTDATNASRTMLFNIHKQEWDQELLDLFGIPEPLLPEVMDSAADFGQIVGNGRLDGASVMGMAGDQQAALFGQTCFETGMAKSTYGTGCFLMLNTGEKALTSEHRLLTTIAYRLNGKPVYALEGSIFIAGAAVQWLRDGLQLIRSACETEPLAEGTPVDHGVYLVPAFTGLGAPYWDPNARGAIFGLTRDTGIKEIVTAGLQSVCYQTKDLQRAMQKDGLRPIALRVDGGMVANNWVLQFLADTLGATVDRPRMVETTALGAAYLAGLQAGVYESLEALQEAWQCDRRFEPEMSKDNRDKLYAGWCSAVARLQSNPESPT